jgi:CRISPR-associated protein Cmr2
MEKKMSWQKPDEKYWNNKFAAYMHDPFDKVFDIKGHEDRSKEIIDIIAPNISLSGEFWKTADMIASGFERGLVPGYDHDPIKSGAVDFISNPIITHPVSKNNSLKIDLPHNLNKDDFFNELYKYIKDVI